MDNGPTFNLRYNPEWELCVGKKHEFPKQMLSLERERKNDSRIEEERKLAKKGELQRTVSFNHNLC